MKKAAWDIEDVLQRHGRLMVKWWLQAAKRSGLSKNESRVILKEATKSSYLHLIQTLENHSEPPDKMLTHQNRDRLIGNYSHIDMTARQAKRSTDN